MYKPLVFLVLIVGSTLARHINNDGLSLIKHFEGFFPNFYKDPVVSDHTPLINLS